MRKRSAQSNDAFQHLHTRQAFSLIELLLAMGMIGILSVSVIYALNIRLSFIHTYNSERTQQKRALEQAQMQYLLTNWNLLKETEIPQNEASAKPICKQGVTTDATCVNLDELVPEFIVGIPQDRAEPNPNYSGFTVFQMQSKPFVTPSHSGELPIEQVAVSSTPAAECTFSVLGTLDMLPGEDRARAIVIDGTNDFGYVNMRTGHIVKFRLSDMQRVAGIFGVLGGSTIASAQIANGFAYFFPSGFPAKVVEVDLSDFTVAQVFSHPSENSNAGAIYDAVRDAFVVTLNFPFSAPYRFMTITRSPLTNETVFNVPAPYGPVWRIVTDGTYAYMTAQGNGGPSPLKIYKYALADLGAGPVADITLNADEVSAGFTYAIDTVHGFAYFSTYAGYSSEQPLKLVKIDLSTFQRVDAIPLGEGAGAMVIDPDANQAFIAIDATPDPDRIQKIDLATFTLGDSIDLFDADDDPYYAAFDPATKTAYFTMDTFPGKVVKICAR